MTASFAAFTLPLVVGLRIVRRWVNRRCGRWPANRRSA